MGNGSSTRSTSARLRREIAIEAEPSSPEAGMLATEAGVRIVETDPIAGGDDAKKEKGG